MPTLRQIVYNIRNAPQGGRSQRDKGFSDRQLAYAFRACTNQILLSTYFNNRGQRMAEINPQYAQDMGVVALKTADITDSPDVTWGVNVKKVVIPKLVDLPQNSGLVFFGRADKRTTIYLPDVAMGEMDDFRTYKKRDDVFAAQMGDTIYLYGEDVDRLCYVNIRGIFDDPTSVVQFDADGNETCFDWDKTPYPIQTTIEQSVYDMVWQKYILGNAQLPDDISNDQKKEAVS